MIIVLVHTPIVHSCSSSDSKVMKENMFFFVNSHFCKFVRKNLIKLFDRKIVHKSKKNDSYFNGSP